MENDKNAVFWIVGVLLIAGVGGYFLFGRNSNIDYFGPKEGDKSNYTNPTDTPKNTNPDINIKDNKKDMENTKTTNSGLQITVLKEGSGSVAESGKKVTVHYTGTFADGKKFDSSVDRGEPFSFNLGAGQVIKGWDEGVLGMKVGEKRKLVIPPTLGYGEKDYGPIPGNSTLYFDVELLGVN